MAPALNHPSGVSFAEERHPHVHTDAATYYGDETYARSRTYSQVGVPLANPWTGTHFSIVVPSSWLQSRAQKTTRL